MARWTYRSDQEEPAYVVEWLTSAGTVIDFSSGYTFTLKLVNTATGATTVTKTTNITGAATAPNVTVAWAVSELNIAPAVYRVHLVASTGGRDRIFNPADPELIEIVAAPT